jgi:hypothetical protein
MSQTKILANQQFESTILPEERQKGDLINQRGRYCLACLGFFPQESSIGPRTNSFKQSFSISKLPVGQ